ncbi:MAG: FAD-dependent oxidoreductase [Paracoccus aminovorans]|nr:FAD-dependent oxidoreductase [Paracoccus aminovorans]
MSLDATRNYDLIVIGAGPAGMTAAATAAAQGLSVCVIDEQKAPGGQIWRGIEGNAGTAIGRALGPDYLKGAATAQALRQSGAELCLGAQVWQIEPGFRVFLSQDGRSRRIDGRALLLATGAQERPNPFPGWTLPGVMTVGAAQILLKTAQSIPDGPVWVAGTGPLPLLYMAQLLDQGGRIAGFIDTAPAANFRRALPMAPSLLRAPKGLLKGLSWLRKLRRHGVPHYKAAHGLEAIGDGCLQRLRFTTGKGQRIEAEAALLLAHEGVVPSVHMGMALGCAHDWREDQACFVPRLDGWGETSVPGVFVAGDGGGILGADAAVELGRIAGLGIARKLAVLDDARANDAAAPARKVLRKLAAMRPFLDALYRPRPEVFLPAPDTVVCRCECQSAGAISAAAARGAPDPNQVKIATRAGMGPRQGRQCGYTVAALVAQAHGQPMGSVGYLNIRAPLKPITLGEARTLGEA